MAFVDEISYEFEFAKKADFSDAKRATSETSDAALLNLAPGTRYRFRVRAVGEEGGPGDWSEPVQAVTPSKRESLIEVVIARMQTIRQSNGFQTDIGERVHDFETNFDGTEDGELPALSVCDTIASHELAGNQATATGQIDTVNLQLRVFCRSDARPGDLRKMISDIWKAIKVDPQWGGLAMQTFPKRSGIVLSEEAFQIGGAAVEIEVHIFNTNFGS